MLQGADLAEALARVPLIELHGPWARAVAFQHLRAAPPWLPTREPAPAALARQRRVARGALYAERRLWFRLP
jgi:hypothetical protein